MTHTRKQKRGAAAGDCQDPPELIRVVRAARDRLVSWHRELVLATNAGAIVSNLDGYTLAKAEFEAGRALAELLRVWCAPFDRFSPETHFALTQALKAVCFPSRVWDAVLGAGQEALTRYRMGLAVAAKSAGAVDRAIGRMDIVLERALATEKSPNPVVRDSLTVLSRLQGGEGLTAKQWVRELKKPENGGHNVSEEYIRGPVRNALVRYGLRNDRNGLGYYFDRSAVGRADVVSM